MSNSDNSTRTLSDAGVAALLRLATDPPDVLAEIEGLAELTPKELWQEITGRWQYLGQKQFRVVTAQLLDIPDYRFDRWRRHTELVQSVRRRLAALCELLALLVCRKLNSVSEHDLRATMTILRGLKEDADDNTIEEVLSILRPQFDESPQAPSG